MRIPTFGQFERQAGTISTIFDHLNALQTQAESGKKLIQPSDDPVLSSQITNLQNYIDQVGTYTYNTNIAKTRMDLFTSTIKSAVSSVSDVQSLIQKAQNGTLRDSDRAEIAKQLQADLGSLMNAANVQDSDGRYIFSGYNSNKPAYIQTSSGFQYQGGFTPSMIDIGQNTNTIFNDVGYNVFGNANTGNGTFSVTAGSGNTGTAYATGTVGSGYISDTYTVTMVTNSSGQLAYQVVGTNSGQVIPPPPATTPASAPAYNPGPNGFDISFNGVSLNISGSANVGDTFQIQPSTKQDVFTSIQNIITLLNTPLTNQGKFNQVLSQGSASIQQVFNNMNSYQSTLGSRSAAVNSQATLNSDIISKQNIAKGTLEGADMASVFSQLSQESLALQVAQQSYLKIQDVLSQILKV